MMKANDLTPLLEAFLVNFEQTVDDALRSGALAGNAHVMIQIRDGISFECLEGLQRLAVQYRSNGFGAQVTRGYPEGCGRGFEVWPETPLLELGNRKRE